MFYASVKIGPANLNSFNGSLFYHFDDFHLPKQILYIYGFHEFRLESFPDRYEQPTGMASCHIIYDFAEERI